MAVSMPVYRAGRLFPALVRTVTPLAIAVSRLLRIGPVSFLRIFCVEENGLLFFNYHGSLQYET